MTQKPSLPPAVYIQTNDALRQVAQQFAQEPSLAIDTESNSLYAYREHVCLFQLSTRSGDYIIDPLKITDMSPLGEILANPAIEKVFHAAEYDIMCIKRDYQFEFNNIFDTMIAARTCGYTFIGLGNLLEEFFGIQVDKSHQRDDWGKRPLPKDSLLYAQMDTHYLLGLRDKLYEQLVAAERLEEATESFDELRYTPAAEATFDPEGFWRVGRSRDMTRRQMAILRELYLWREQVAQKRNCPPFKILGNAVLVDLAKAAPGDKTALGKVKGVSRLVLRRYGADLLDAIEVGRKTRVPQPPVYQQAAAPAVMERYAALREWRKERAIQRGVESDVIVSKNVLWLLAEQAPRSLDDMQGIPGLGPWRLSHYGAELLAVLQTR